MSYDYPVHGADYPWRRPLPVENSFQSAAATPDEQPHDPISNPSHYNEGREIAPLDVIYDWKLSFGPATALKYIARLGRKVKVGQLPREAAIEDANKAVEYLQDYVERLQTKEIEP